MRQRCLGQHQHVGFVGKLGRSLMKNGVMACTIACHQGLVGIGAQHGVQADVAPLFRGMGMQQGAAWIDRAGCRTKQAYARPAAHRFRRHRVIDLQDPNWNDVPRDIDGGRSR